MASPTGGWGYRSDTEILFPMRVAPSLAEQRGPRWRALVQRVLATEDGSLDQLAFTLLMIRLCGCLTCHTDTYRAMRGCTFCAVHAVRRFRGQDEDLESRFEAAKREVLAELQAADPRKVM